VDAKGSTSRAWRGGRGRRLEGGALVLVVFQEGKIHGRLDRADGEEHLPLPELRADRLQMPNSALRRAREGVGHGPRRDEALRGPLWNHP
jgi:hypothetical protein